MNLLDCILGDESKNADNSKLVINSSQFNNENNISFDLDLQKWSDEKKKLKSY